MQSILDDIVENLPSTPFEATEMGQILLHGTEAQLRMRIAQLEDDRAAQDEKIKKLEDALGTMVKAIDDRLANMDRAVDANTMFRFRVIHALVETGLIPEHTESDPKSVPAAIAEIVSSLNDNWDSTRHNRSLINGLIKRMDHN